MAELPWSTISSSLFSSKRILLWDDLVGVFSCMRVVIIDGGDKPSENESECFFCCCGRGDCCEVIGGTETIGIRVWGWGRWSLVVMIQNSLTR